MSDDTQEEVIEVIDSAILLGLIEHSGVAGDGETTYSVNMERFEEVEKAVMFCRFLLKRPL